MARYGRILRTPGIFGLIAATTLTRIPFSVNSLGVLLFLRAETGSFGLAGACVGALALGAGFGAPIAARLVDRRGVRMLMPLALAHAASAAALIALGLGAATAPALLIAAALMGSTYPPAGSVLRGRWPELLDDGELVSAAYALDSVLIEISFVTGPLITAAVVAVASPQLALGGSAVLVILGTVIFVALLPRSSVEHEDHGFYGVLGALAAPAIRNVALSTVPFGFCIGTIEVALPAFTHVEGRDELAGVLLAIWSAASGIGGLAYGARAIRGELITTYLRIAWVFPLACLPLLVAFSPLSMAFLVVFAGLPIAPLIASRNELLAAVAPRGTTTEAFTWLTTALIAGLAAGAAAGGALVELDGWELAVIVGVVVAVAGGVASFAARHRLAPQPT